MAQTLQTCEIPGFVSSADVANNFVNFPAAFANLRGTASDVRQLTTHGTVACSSGFLGRIIWLNWKLGHDKAMQLGLVVFLLPKASSQIVGLRSKEWLWCWKYPPIRMEMLCFHTDSEHTMHSEGDILLGYLWRSLKLATGQVQAWMSWTYSLLSGKRKIRKLYLVLIASIPLVALSYE